MAAPGPPQPPTFPSEVELITVDAVVLDREGRPVAGLTRDDFVLEEDGQEREIVSFEAFATEGPAAVPAPAAAPVAASAGRSSPERPSPWSSTTSRWAGGTRTTSSRRSRPSSSGRRGTVTR
jgi:hypothetical protein